MVAVGIWAVPLFGGEALVMPAGIGLFHCWLVAAAVSLAAVACALLVASLAQTTQQSTIVGGIGNILMAAIGGIMVPKFMMPGAMQTLAEWSPMAWALNGFHTVMLRDGGFSAILPDLLKMTRLRGPGHRRRVLAQPEPRRMNADLRLALKTLIVEACDRDCDPASITDDEILFGPEAPLHSDSLDALQVSMAIKKQYGLRLPDSKETRRILSSVANRPNIPMSGWPAVHDASGSTLPKPPCSAPAAIRRRPWPRRCGTANAAPASARWASGPFPFSACLWPKPNPWMRRAEQAIRQVAGQLGAAARRNATVHCLVVLPDRPFRAVRQALRPPRRQRLVQPPDRRMARPSRPTRQLLQRLHFRLSPSTRRAA